MTAEVAILNKSAVALAADSAVSIGTAPNLKIYNTVNKIFELSGHSPIGIMIYGRLDFMGLPLETIIKEYRKHIGSKRFAKISDARDDFRDYLLKNVPVSNKDDLKNAFLLIHNLFSKANSAIDGRVMDDVLERGAFKKSKVNTIAQTYLKEQIDRLKTRPFAKGFRRKAIPVPYKEVVEELIEHCFRSNFPTDTTKKLIRDFAGYALTKQTLTDYRTGIVIAGFGETELCPSLAQFEMDGIVDGKLKLIDKPYVDIGRQGPEADIVGFAQDDMMKSFLNGVDPEIHRYFNELHASAINDTAALILKALLNNPSREASARAAVQKELDTLSAEGVGLHPT